MSNYPNMSYCMFENTDMAMDQLMEAMNEVTKMKDLDLSRSEQKAFQQLYYKCQDFIEVAERLMQTEE